jgi:hypothetical protein
LNFMRPIILACSVLFIVVLLADSPRAADTAAPATNALRAPNLASSKILEYLSAHRRELVRITPKPFHVSFFVEHPEKSSMCTDPGEWIYGPHDQHWIHVFVSPAGTNAMASGAGKYPAGTMILKQKFLDEEGTNTVFFTGMFKREPGYNPEMGDWQFFTLDQSGERITASGRIDSCMDCHAMYAATDFVTRKYITSKEHVVR